MSSLIKKMLERWSISRCRKTSLDTIGALSLTLAIKAEFHHKRRESHRCRPEAITSVSIRRKGRVRGWRTVVATLQSGLAWWCQWLQSHLLDLPVSLQGRESWLRSRSRQLHWGRTLCDMVTVEEVWTSRLEEAVDHDREVRTSNENQVLLAILAAKGRLIYRTRVQGVSRRWSGRRPQRWIHTTGRTVRNRWVSSTHIVLALLSSGHRKGW